MRHGCVRQPHRPRHWHQGGFTLVEAIGSIFLVSLLLVAALNAAGVSARMRQTASDRDFAAVLANDLHEEIVQKGYGSTSSGTIPDTLFISGSRAAVTTIDQYNGLTEIPPVRASGGAISGSTGWRRQTTVERASASAPSSTGTTETGVKRITVRVLRGTTEVYSIQFLRSRAWDDAKD